MIKELGYACINSTLQKQKISTNRGMKQATFKAKGLEYASELALKNVIDLEKIIHWNEANDIRLFRISSDLFPWYSEYNVEQLKDYKEIIDILSRIGAYAKAHNHRLSAHPGPFNLLASPNEAVVKKTLIELENHSKVFDMLGLSNSPYNKINIHIGATYNNKELAAKTWISNRKRLSDSCRSRLTVENDDKASMWSVRELHDMVYQECGVPIVFDYHHHQFCTGDLSEYDALSLAIKTWPAGITPATHYSESKALHENDMSIKLQAHSDLINGPINSYDHDIVVMIECKAKEVGLLAYRNKLNNSKNILKG
jgi:UV DNA damage endonuclease